jgi:hypothetical protein
MHRPSCRSEVTMVSSVTRPRNDLFQPPDADRADRRRTTSPSRRAYVSVRAAAHGRPGESAANSESVVARGRRRVAVEPAAAPDRAKRTLFPEPRSPTAAHMGSPWTAFTAPFRDRDDDETRRRTDHRRQATGVRWPDERSAPSCCCGMAILSKLEKTVAPMDADGDASR